MNRKQMIEVAIRVMTEDYYTETPAARRGRALGYTGLEHVRGCGSDDPDAHLCLPEHWAQCACFIQGCAVVDALVAAGCVPSDALTRENDALRAVHAPLGAVAAAAEDHLANPCDETRAALAVALARAVGDGALARGVSATPEAAMMQGKWPKRVGDDELAAVTPDERNEP